MSRKFLFWFAAVLAALGAGETARAGTKVWTGAGSLSWSSPANWSPSGAPGIADNVTFTNAAFADSPLALGGPVNNVVDGSLRVNSLGYFNIVGFHNTMVTAPLTVEGTSATDVAFVMDDGQPAAFFVGSTQADGPADEVYASVTGDTLTVNNPKANLSVTQASATSGAHRATLDLSALSKFNCTVSNVLVGHDYGVPITRPTGTLILGGESVITAKLISVADAYQNAGAISYIHLGERNFLNVDRIRIALHKCVATMDVNQTVASATVTFRGSSGQGRQASWEIGDEYEPDVNSGYFTSSQSTGILDLSRATVDGLVDKIVLGRGQTNAPTRTGDGNGTLTFGGGAINANAIDMGIQLSGGGSAGRGVLNINNDDGVHPAVLTVNSNLNMAVQLPGNTETTGSTAIINVNGGVLEVGGDIIDGDGTSTINLTGGGRINLKPSGDSTPGNIGVDTLNIEDGAITNYASLSAGTIALSGAATQFTVYAGQTLSPGRESIRTLTVNGGNLVLRGELEIDVNKSGATLKSDQISTTAKVDLGGTLRVRASGSALAAGDTFKLLNAAIVPGSNLREPIVPSPGAGLAWENNLDSNGTIKVIAIPEPATPPKLTIAATASSITLSWPLEYKTFLLRGQTNAGGLSTNWGPIAGVSGNQITLPINRTNRSVFFELGQ